MHTVKCAKPQLKSHKPQQFLDVSASIKTINRDLRTHTSSPFQIPIYARTPKKIMNIMIQERTIGGFPMNGGSLRRATQRAAVGRNQEQELGDTEMN